MSQSKSTKFQPNSKADEATRLAAIAALTPGLAAMGLPACLITPDHRFAFANQAYMTLTGQPHRTLTGFAVTDALSASEYEVVHPYLVAALERGEASTFNRQWVDPDGYSHWVEVNYFPQRLADEEGSILGVLAVVSNAERLMALEAKTLARERLLRQLTDSAGLSIVYMDTNLVVQFANKPFFDWTGRPEREVMHRKITETFDAATVAFYEPLAARALAGETFSIETLSKTRRDTPRHIQASFFPDQCETGEITGLFLLARDIEDDYQLRNNLVSQERELRAIADNIGMPLFKSDRNFIFQYVNQVACDWFGRTEAQILGLHWRDIYGESQFAEVKAHADQALAGIPVAYERHARFPGRPPGHIRANIFPNRDANDEVIGLYVVVADAEHDHRLRSELIQRERQLKMITNNIDMPLAYIDADERFRFYNQTGTEWTGLSEAQIAGKRVDEIFSNDVMDIVRPYLTKALAGETQTYDRLSDFPQRGERWIRAHLVPDIQDDGRVAGVYSVLIDIHDDVMLRQSLEQQERQLRLFTDNIPEAIAYLDTERRYKFVNNTFLKLQGKSRLDVIGKTSAEILGDNAAQLAEPHVERAFKGDTVVYERLVKTANGTERWMRVRTVPDLADDGTVQGLYVVGVDIHDAKATQDALRTSETELRSAMDSLPHPMSYIDRSFKYQLINKRLEQVLGKTREQVIGTEIATIFGHAKFEDIKPLLEKVLAGETLSLEQLVTQADGTQRWMILRCTPRRDELGNIIGFYSASTDVDELKRTELELRRANWMLSSHFENTPLAVIEWDPGFRIRRWSKQAENVFGWQETEVMGKLFDDWSFVVPSDVEQVKLTGERLKLQTTQRATSLNRNYRKDGKVIWCEWYNSNLCDESGNVVSVLSLVQDVTARVHAEERLVHQATHDSLTGLPNRAMLQDRLRQGIARARRSGQRLAVLFVDLDRFKDVNDTLGHRIGDELLREMAARLTRIVRENDLLVRLSGDEFMVVLEQLDDPHSPEKIASKLLNELRTPVLIEGHEIHVSGSIGISIFPDDAADVETLFKNADMAMYRAKELGKNGYQVFSRDLAEHGTAMRLMENALRAALGRDELELYFQPKVDMKTNRIIGAEALLRWHHPARGLVMPGEFIHLAEETGLVHDIGNWVLDNAFARLKIWHNLADNGEAAFADLQMAVNLSAGQFRATNLADRIAERITRAQCKPTAVEVEITETGLLRDPEGVGKTLAALRRLGVRVAIDDFGTGFSSLTHLKRFQIDTLKIDRSFVADIIIDRDDAAIVSAVIALAHALEIDVVAEGVETDAQRTLLSQQGCEAYQGYFFSIPLPAAEFEALVRKKHQHA